MSKIIAGEAASRSGLFFRPDIPDLNLLGNWAREQSQPKLAIVTVGEFCEIPPRGLFFNSSGSTDLLEPELLYWLSEVEETGPLRVPRVFLPVFRCNHVLAVPMHTPIWQAGVIAIPLPTPWQELAREMEGVGCEFALNAESADRKTALAQLALRPVRARPPPHSPPNHVHAAPEHRASSIRLAQSA